MDGFAKGSSGAHSCLWGNMKYLQIKTGGKFSEKLFCDLCIPLRHLYHFYHKAVFEHCSCKTEKVRFCRELKTLTKSEISWTKTRKKCSKKLLSEVCIHFRELKLTLHCKVWKLCLRGICEAILSVTWRPVVSKEISSVEYWREAL